MKIIIRDNQLWRLQTENNGKEIKMIKILMTPLLRNLTKISKTNNLKCSNNCWINNKQFMVASLIHLIGGIPTSKIFRMFRDWRGILTIKIFRKFRVWNYRVLVLKFLNVSEVFLLWRKMFLKRGLKLKGLNSLINSMKISRPILKLKKVIFIARLKIQSKKVLEKQL